MNAGFHLDPQEIIIRKVNRHWIDLLPVAVSTTILLIMVLVGGFIYGRYSNLVPGLTPGLVVLILLVVLLIAVFIFFAGVFVYRQNYLVLTNLHLVLVEQKGVFNREVSQLSLARLQDVAGRRTGLLATVLNFGIVEVQSAGEHDKFIFTNAPAPQQLSDQCLEAHEAYRRANPTQDSGV
jgi:uncharacterized membrane protein YdbT with pleckstrin-like domain